MTTHFGLITPVYLSIPILSSPSTDLFSSQPFASAPHFSFFCNPNFIHSSTSLGHLTAILLKCLYHIIISLLYLSKYICWTNFSLLTLHTFSLLYLMLAHCGRVTQICVFTFQLCRTVDADLRF